GDKIVEVGASECIDNDVKLGGIVGSLLNGVGGAGLRHQFNGRDIGQQGVAAAIDLRLVVQSRVTGHNDGSNAVGNAFAKRQPLRLSNITDQRTDGRFIPEV